MSIVHLENEMESQQSRKLPQYTVVTLASLTAFSIGTYLSWTSPALPLYDQTGTLSITVQRGSLICSLLPLGAVPATLPAGIIADKIGRKRTIYLTVLSLFSCWFIIIFVNSILWICFARFLAGIACGTASIVVPMYLHEIADSDIRKSLDVVIQLQISLGILFTYVVGLAESLSIIAVLCALIPGFLLLVLPFIPESPAWLIMQDQKDDADHAIRRLRGRHYRTQEELTRMEVRSNESRRRKRANVFELRHCKRAVVVALALIAIQQLSGIGALIFYTENIVKAADSPLNPTISTVLVGSSQVIATCLSTILIDRAGRKILLFASSSLMAVCAFVSSGYFHFQNTHDVSNVSWLPLLSFVLFAAAFAVGFAPIPWILIDELFTRDTKTIAVTVIATSTWFLVFLVTICFPGITETTGISTIFAVYGIFSLIGTAFVAIIVPETKDKTGEQARAELYRSPNASRT